MNEPRMIAHYEIGALLGRGGMGEVYRAVDTRMYRRPVALKLISEALGSDPRALSRFDLEIETAANLQHPNIVTIYDRGEYDGRRFFVMELLEGVDLSVAVKDRAGRTLEDRLEIVRQLCEALDYAHRQGVVHRDIKPANIMLVRAGGAEHVKLLDFGIAKVTRADRTRTVVQPGTLLYMSPEQLRDDVVDAGSDLFAVGVVAYELCCGVHPFHAKTEYLVSSNIMLQKPPPARSHDPSLPEALDVLFDRLLEKERDKRPATAGDVAAEIRRLLGQLRGGSTDSEPHVYGKLDEMTTSMVERLVHWAKTKEAAGAYLEALEGFKRALLLAPEARWLEPPIARLEARLADGAPTDAANSDDARSTSARDRHRETFVVESLAQATAAFDDGDVDRASSIIAGVMRRFPDEPRALELMDRIVLIAGRGIPVKPFRQALREASRALEAGDVAAARASCEKAVALWPDAEEAVTLGREIEKRRHVELAEALRRCQDLVGRAAAGEVPDDEIESFLAGVREPLARAEILGGPPETLQEIQETSDRLAREARRRVSDRRERDERAEAERRAEIGKILSDGRERIVSAERALAGDVAEARAAHEDLAGLAEPIARALALDSQNGEARGLVAAADALRKRLAAHVAEEEAEAERRERVRLAREEEDRARREREEVLRKENAERRERERLAREEEDRARREREDVLRRENAAREERERRARAERDRAEREEREAAERERERVAIEKGLAEVEALAKRGSSKEALRSYRTLRSRGGGHPDWRELSEPIAPRVAGWEAELAADRARTARRFGIAGGAAVLVVGGIFLATRLAGPGTTKGPLASPPTAPPVASNIPVKPAVPDSGSHTAPVPDSGGTTSRETPVRPPPAPAIQANPTVPESVIQDLERRLAAARIGPGASLSSVRAALAAAETGRASAASAVNRYPGNGRVAALASDLAAATKTLEARRDELERPAPSNPPEQAAAPAITPKPPPAAPPAPIPIAPAQKPGDDLAAKPKGSLTADEAGMRLALDRLARLYATKDPAQIRSVWPSFQEPPGLQDLHVLKLTFQRIVVDPGARTATVDQTIEQNLGKGRDISASQHVVYRFEPHGDAWTIAESRIVR